ncbi:hypothetical protein ACOBQX_03155 [Actinokineospora sp. G85]|uniref:hypothetical protein n=1 Tax=Actinokineospora sp. G85 TaxID=3406626 RepID=UPI003C782A0D
MTGNRLGRVSLRLDVVYCLIVGFSVAVSAPFTTGVVRLPVGVVVAIGAVVAGWAVIVWWLVSTKPLRLGLRLVMVANTVAAVALVAVSVTATDLLVVGVLVAVAIEVAAFALSQFVALRRLAMPAAAR